MNNFSPDKIILGHNQFFGTDHMSSERGSERAAYFSDIKNVISIIKYAYDSGANGLMLSTHEYSKVIVDEISKDKELKNNLNIYVLLPYMAKYVRMANERGIINMISEILAGADWKQKYSILSTGGLGVMKGDITSIISSMIDIELLTFRKLNVKAVFLHNALSDMIAALKLDEIIHLFMQHITIKYQVTPAFCTLNSSLLMNYLHQLKINRPLIMAPFNPIGFQMNPSREVVEKVMANIPTKIIAMSTLAAGHVDPNISFQYISSLSNIKSVIVGSSSYDHIDQNFELIKKYL